MKLKIFGKYYGWLPYYMVDLHMNTGTVQRRHPFYIWRQKDGGFRWKTPRTLNFKTVDTITAWFLSDITYHFHWGADVKLWELEDK